MSTWHPSALAGFLTADYDLDGGDALTVQPVTALITQVDFTGATFLGDLDGGEFLGDPIALSSLTFVGGLLDADPATLTSVSLGDVIGALVFFLDTGSPATSLLVAYEDKRADNTALAFTGTGNPLTVDWPAGIGSI